MGQTSSSAKITSHDRAVFQLKQQRDKIRQYQKRLDHLIDQQNKLAKQCLPNDPAKAKFYLRCKRKQQTTRERTYEQLETLEGLIGTIEQKMVESEVMKSLAQGNSILKELNQEMNVDKIDKIMDDLYEERVKVDEVSDALGSMVPDVEVEDEFEALLKETNKNKESNQTHENERLKDLPEVTSDPLLPNAPKNKLEKPQVDRPAEALLS